MPAAYLDPETTQFIIKSTHRTLLLTYTTIYTALLTKFYGKVLQYRKSKVCTVACCVTPPIPHDLGQIVSSDLVILLSWGATQPCGRHISASDGLDLLNSTELGLGQQLCVGKQVDV